MMRQYCCAGRAVVRVETRSHERQEIVGIVGRLQPLQQRQQLALGKRDVLHVDHGVGAGQLEARHARVAIGRLAAHQAEEVGLVIGHAAPGQEALARGRLPVEGHQRPAEGIAAVMVVDVHGEPAHADFGEGVGHAPGEAVDVAFHRHLQGDAFLLGEVDRRAQTAAQEVLVEQFGEVQPAGGQLHHAALEGADEVAPLPGRGLGQELFDLPEALAGELEPAGFVAGLLLRRQGQLHRLTDELGMLVGGDFLLLGVADVDMAVLDDEDRSSGGPAGGGGVSAAKPGRSNPAADASPAAQKWRRERPGSPPGETDE